MLPGRTGVGGLPHAVALIDCPAHIADVARPDVNDVGIGGRHGDRTDRSHVLFIEDRLPHHAAIGGLPGSAARSSDVIDRGLAGNTGYSGYASRAEGTDLPPLHSGIKRRIVLLGESEGRKQKTGE